MHIGLGQLDAAVCLFYDFSQQVALQVGHLAAGSRTGAPADIPPGIAILPYPVDFITGKDVVERNLLAQLHILHDGGKQHELFGKIVAIDMLADVDAVVEQRLHQVTVIIVLRPEVLV